MSLSITKTPLVISRSPKVQCTRLVHDGKKVIELFESAGVTQTAQTLFCGTAEECAAEIARLSLAPLPAVLRLPPTV